MARSYLPDHPETQNNMPVQKASKRCLVSANLLLPPFVVVAASILCAALVTASPLLAQAAGQSQPGAARPPAVQDRNVKRDPQGHPDLTGMWNNQYTPDLRRAIEGGELPFTPYGAERWTNVDLKDDPTGLCLPVGPTRAFTAPFPLYFLQTPKVIGVLFEYQTTWRVFYLDQEHPDNLGDYSEFFGHSTAKWQGDALLVDTVGINDRSWLDTAGHEHSDKLHLTERFEKLTENTIKYTVTYDDPVFFTKPFTIVRTFERADDKDRILPYSCNENNVDRDQLSSFKPNLKR
jgi:hypothetical protein